MGDPEIDSGFVFDDEGRTDVLNSPFFDVFFGSDETADDYLDRILYRLSLSLEEHIRPGRWILNGQSPPPPLPATSPVDTILRTSMKVKIVKWHAVASWTWDAQDETCGICRMAFDGCCPDCKFPGDDCPLIWGACNHSFHLHCILKWVNSQTTQPHCPMCRREWQFKA
ncbi:hypothetical protein M5K25_002223 [Dendrobium thyrsiflorum]|uniref:Anaphase-promoting complex subunit 11 n=1 Tax=Dendrobium thyrsiflorum TaxID=117978 RepID=A0ABD0VTV6_DENTH